MQFSTFSFSPAIHEAIAHAGFETPTPVQRESIGPALDGRDILASAQTGSGKTAAFVLPILQKLDGAPRPARGRPRALILAPTRELAGQIAEVIQTLSRGTRVSHATIFGGVNKKRQIEALRRGIDIAVATPGRLLDLAGEREIDLREVATVVLDEADRMLDMGFIPDVRRIIALLPRKRQSLFFSATLPEEVQKLSQELLHDPVRVSVERERSAAPKIDQHLLFVDRKEKRDALRMLLTERRSFRAIVFTRTKYKARDIARHLNKNGITADDLHGNKSQNARQRALKDFHSGRIHVLVATDIASRGIDVEEIDQVINYELPMEPESYVHRIGRTARAGRSGEAFSLCDDSELTQLRDIQKEIGNEIPRYEDHPFHSVSIAGDAIRATRPQTNRGNGGKGGNGRGGNGRNGNRRNDSRNNGSRSSGRSSGRGNGSRPGNGPGRGRRSSAA